MDAVPWPDMSSPGEFVSVGVYMIPFALPVAPLPVVVAALYAEANKTDTSMKDDQASTRKALKNDLPILRCSWAWLKAAKAVLIVHTWAAAVTLLPSYICLIHNWTPIARIALWVLLSAAFLRIFFSRLSSHFAGTRTCKGNWALLK